MRASKSLSGLALVQGRGRYSGPTIVYLKAALLSEDPRVLPR